MVKKCEKNTHFNHRKGGIMKKDKMIYFLVNFAAIFTILSTDIKILEIIAIVALVGNTARRMI